MSSGCTDAVLVRNPHPRLRLGLAVRVVVVTMLSTFAFAFLGSTVTNQAFPAVAGGVLFGLVSRALDTIPGLHALTPRLPLSDKGTDV